VPLMNGLRATVSRGKRPQQSLTGCEKPSRPSLTLEALFTINDLGRIHS
jgi:hypothetical protein